ncbi:Hypothetical_protein [Hexamita inflata]|uniref:Hypothetical_protein n=1 Tax=Hexamita inflata TaxID=28002 RepID=A0AA86QWK6_9EUKA|nr:Hypothetical protein HINF_LOCUS55039 [Hexamita inflata]
MTSTFQDQITCEAHCQTQLCDYDINDQGSIYYYCVKGIYRYANDCNFYCDKGYCDYQNNRPSGYNCTSDFGIYNSINSCQKICDTGVCNSDYNLGAQRNEYFCEPKPNKDIYWLFLLIPVVIIMLTLLIWCCCKHIDRLMIQKALFFEKNKLQAMKDINNNENKQDIPQVQDNLLSSQEQAQINIPIQNSLTNKQKPAGQNNQSDQTQEIMFMTL